MKNFLCPLIALFLTACIPSDTWLRHTECLITGTIPGDAPEEVLLSLPGTRSEYSTKLWEQYGLSSAAGQTYLIDRDGTILAINPMADELERLLREKL